MIDFAMLKARPSHIGKAKQELVKLLARDEGFVGAGVASTKAGDWEIVVLVTDKDSPAAARVPKVWKGFPVRTERSGAPRKFREP